MSSHSSPQPSSRDSPKRKRSSSPEVDTPQLDGANDDAKLQYAYDEDDAVQDFLVAKRRKVERPKRLNYVPYMTLRGHKRGVAAVRFSPDGKWIASCCKKKHLHTTPRTPLIQDSRRLHNQNLAHLHRRPLPNPRRPPRRHLLHSLVPRLPSPRLGLRRQAHPPLGHQYRKMHAHASCRASQLYLQPSLLAKREHARLRILR